MASSCYFEYNHNVKLLRHDDSQHPKSPNMIPVKGLLHKSAHRLSSRLLRNPKIAFKTTQCPDPTAHTVPTAFHGSRTCSKVATTAFATNVTSMTTAKSTSSKISKMRCWTYKTGGLRDEKRCLTCKTGSRNEQRYWTCKTETGSEDSKSSGRLWVRILLRRSIEGHRVRSLKPSRQDGGSW